MMLEGEFDSEWRRPDFMPIREGFDQLCRSLCTEISQAQNHLTQYNDNGYNNTEQTWFK
jgi:hypothetical protein